MLDQKMDCLLAEGAGRPLHAVRPAGVARLLGALPKPQAQLLRDLGFKGKAGELHYLPGPDGLAAAVVGLGDDRSPYAFGRLAYALPEGTTWSLQEGDFDESAAALGFALGAYQYRALKLAEREPARLIRPAGSDASIAQAAAIWMVRDLINTPANLLGPVELADAAAALGRRYGAGITVAEGDALETGYPTVAAVGRGSSRPPRVVTFQWQGSSAHADAPLVSLCGKGVCFDTGGYDLKPSSAMLRMKKDMGGAACVLGLARMIMDADLPIRLHVRIGCVENSISGTAMRPLDVIRTRQGLTVEVGNTDAEGRLVLCDLLAEACDARPAVLVDYATLTGAARVALGPDLPALFCNDDALADRICRVGSESHDPVWRLPLWDGYDAWLDSSTADLNNISSKPFAGAIIAALYLRRFVQKGTPWAHFDVYAWNDQTRPGRAEGGEAQAVRGMFETIKNQFGSLKIA